MQRTFYFAPDELEFIKSKPEGYIRSLVLGEMGKKDQEIINRGVEAENRGVPQFTAAERSLLQEANLKRRKAKEIKVKGGIVKIPAGKKGDGLHTCKVCGSMLPYYKGKCKNCA